MKEESALKQGLKIAGWVVFFLMCFHILMFILSNSPISEICPK